MSCKRQVRGQHVYDETIYIEEFEKEILETIFSGRVQLREDDIVIATYPKSGKFHGPLSDPPSAKNPMDWRPLNQPRSFMDLYQTHH